MCDEWGWASVCLRDKFVGQSDKDISVVWAHGFVVWPIEEPGNNDVGVCTGSGIFILQV
jgi:hypothetical protein